MTGPDRQDSFGAARKRKAQPLCQMKCLASFTQAAHQEYASKLILPYVTCRECEVTKGKTKETISLVIDKWEDNFVPSRINRGVLDGLVTVSLHSRL